MNVPAQSAFEVSETLLRRRHRIGFVFWMACLIATMTGVVALSIMLGAILFRVYDGVSTKPDGSETRIENRGGVPGFMASLTQKVNSSNAESAGFKVGIRGSLWLLGLVAIMAIPVGIGAATFLEEYRVLPGWLRSFIQLNIANLAGVPSIVYGMLGLVVFQRGLMNPKWGLGPVVLSGALTLSLLVLPVIIVATQEALRAVPLSLRQAALALGATPWQVVRDHVLPSALPGILTGTILSLSRAIGETAPLLMVGAAASLLRAPSGPLQRYSALPVEIYNYAREPAEAFRVVAAGGILLLLVMLLSMNAIAILIRNRYARPNSR